MLPAGPLNHAIVRPFSRMIPFSSVLISSPLYFSKRKPRQFRGRKSAECFAISQHVPYFAFVSGSMRPKTLPDGSSA